MASTPPPPRRVHTPPTPLHGPKHDAYEPYSPRRSSRVAAQRKSLAPSSDQKTATFASPRQRRLRAVTPVEVPRGATRTSSQTFSPPSSPTSPAKAPSTAKGKGRALLHPESAATGEANDSAYPDPRAMLPTPSKTPRKRTLHSHTSLSSTARVLFPGRTATIEDAMPDPKKSRRSKQNAYSLASFEAVADDESGSKIPIYTDAKERVPSLDEDEDNPFLTRSTTRTTRVTRKAKKDEKSLQMEQAMRNDEGVIVTFRGKKIFKKFEDEDVNRDTADEDTWSDLEIRRKAGSSTRERPFLRSTYKPRLLFPTEEQRRAREAAEADEADEEALTDIEVPIPQPSSHRKLPAVERTPSKQAFRDLTPPLTVRKTRGSAKKISDVPVAPFSMDVDGTNERDLDDQVSVTSSKKSSVFDTWRRVKSGSRPASSKKREGSPMEAGEGSAPKRTRATAS